MPKPTDIYKGMDANDDFILLHQTHHSQFDVDKFHCSVTLALANYMEIDAESSKVNIPGNTTEDGLDSFQNDNYEIPPVLSLVYRGHGHEISLLLSTDGEILLYGNRPKYSEEDIKMDGSESYYGA